MQSGFSTGDFIAATTLIYNVIEAVRGKALFEYRELVLELEQLQRTLQVIEHLPARGENEAAINATKVAALLVQYPLQEFEAKLKKYSVLQLGGVERRRDSMRAIGRKVQWNLSMADDVVKIRTILAAHVGSLSMRMQALGVRAMLDDANSTTSRGEALDAAMRDVVIAVDSARSATEDSRTAIEQVYTAITTAVVPRL